MKTHILMVHFIASESRFERTGACERRPAPLVFRAALFFALLLFGRKCSVHCVRNSLRVLWAPFEFRPRLALVIIFLDFSRPGPYCVFPYDFFVDGLEWPIVRETFPKNYT